MPAKSEIQRFAWATLLTVLLIACGRADAQAARDSLAVEDCLSFLPDLVNSCSLRQVFNVEGSIGVEDGGVGGEDEAPTGAEGEAGRRRQLRRKLVQSDATFSETCCDLMAVLNDGRCFCQTEVVSLLTGGGGVMGDGSEDRFSTFLQAAAQRAPEGCGFPVFGVLDDRQCARFSTAPAPPAEEGCRLTVADLISRQPGLIFFHEALDLAGLNNFLRSQPDLVVLAPVDAAWQQYARARNQSTAQLLGDESITALLEQHILLEPPQLDAGEMSRRIPTLQNETELTLTRAGDGLAVNGVPVDPDEVISACNGLLASLRGVIDTSGELDQQSLIVPIPRTGPPEEQESSPTAAEEAAPTVSNTRGRAPAVEENVRSQAPESAVPSTEERTEGGREAAPEGRPSPMGAPRAEDRARNAPDASEEPCKSILDTLNDSEDLFAEFTSAAEATRVGAVLASDPNITVFAPANVGRGGAFEGPNAEQALLGHIVPSRIPLQGSDLVQPSAPLSVLSAAGVLLTIEAQATGGGDSGAYTVNGVPVLQSDVRGCNGIIHVLQRQLPLELPAATESAAEPRPGGQRGRGGPASGGGAERLAEAPAQERQGRSSELPQFGAGGVAETPAVEEREVTPGPAAEMEGRGPEADSPCECSVDGFSGEVVVDFRGCRMHILGEEPFCYVVDPSHCGLSMPSQRSKGAGWRHCRVGETSVDYSNTPVEVPGNRKRPSGFARLQPEAEPLARSQEPATAEDCSCSSDGLSGGVDTGASGCWRHPSSIRSICYVASPTRCPQAQPSLSFPGAAFRTCGYGDFTVRGNVAVSVNVKRPSKKFGRQDEACRCTEDGLSGGVATGTRGCGHFLRTVLFNMCYVIDPANCWIAMPSTSYPGAAWRAC